MECATAGRTIKGICTAMGRTSLAIFYPRGGRAPRMLIVLPAVRSVPLTDYATTLSHRLSASDGTVAKLGSDGRECCRGSGLWYLDCCAPIFFSQHSFNLKLLLYRKMKFKLPLI
jgi:hypothetical protein